MEGRRTDNQTRKLLQAEILSGIVMLSEAEACECLGLPSLEPAQALQRYVGQMLGSLIEGRSRYPAFQFDAANRRIYPNFQSLLEFPHVASRSDFWLLNWMLRPHFDFEGSPADALAGQSKEVVRVLLRAIAPEQHGLGQATSNRSVGTPHAAGA